MDWEVHCPLPVCFPFIHFPPYFQLNDIYPKLILSDYMEKITDSTQKNSKSISRYWVRLVAVSMPSIPCLAKAFQGR